MTSSDQFKTIPEFHFFLDSRLSKHSAPIVIMPMLLNCAPEELTTIASARKISASVDMLTKDIFTFNIGLRKRYSSGFLVYYKNYWCGFLTSKDRDATIPEVASRWMDDMFPIATPAYVNSQQMLELIDSIRIVEKSQTRLLDYVTRSAKEKETTKRWKGGDFSKDQVLSKARNDNAIVDAIRIDFSSPNFTFRIKLNRRGLITLYGGSYSELNRLVISKLITVAKSNLSRMNERRRALHADEVRVEPLRIKPDNKLSSEDMKRLKESLSEHYMTAVLYGGNPWLYVSLLDKPDGSAIDLQAYQDEIIITPVIRVSAESLTRLYSVLEEALPSSLLQIT